MRTWDREAILVLSTAGSMKEAKVIAKTLVEKN